MVHPEDDAHATLGSARHDEQLPARTVEGHRNGHERGGQRRKTRPALDRFAQPHVPRQVRLAAFPDRPSTLPGDALGEPGQTLTTRVGEARSQGCAHRLEIQSRTPDEAALAQDAGEEEGVDLVGRVDRDVRGVSGTEPLVAPGRHVDQAARASSARKNTSSMSPGSTAT